MDKVKTFATIAGFAVLGAWARYGQSLLVNGLTGTGFPWATLSINLVGSFAMGFLFFETLERLAVGPTIRTGVLTGFLGAYTTFSTFSLESLHLLEQKEPWYAILYMVGSPLLGLAAAFAGGVLSRTRGRS